MKEFVCREIVGGEIYFSWLKYYNNMLVSKCHSIFILCLVIIVIKGNSISIDKDSENGIAKDNKGLSYFSNGYEA